MQGQRKINQFAFHGLFLAISTILSTITALHHNRFYQAKVLEVFLTFLIPSFFGISILFHLASHIFRKNPFSRISETITYRYKGDWKKHVAVGAILGAVFFGCSFAALQVIASQYTVKADYPYSIVDSVLKGIVGGLGFTLLSSLKKHQDDISIIFIFGFIGVGVGQYIAGQILSVVPISRFYPGLRELLEGLFVGLSFGFLQKEAKQIFIFAITGIFGYGIVYFLGGHLINWVTPKLIDVLPQVTPSNIESFYLRSYYLMIKTSFGLTIGLLLGCLVILFETMSAPPNKACT